MNGKKIFAAVAVLLVLAAGIAAAGCVADPVVTPDEREQIVGEWTADFQSVIATLNSFGIDTSKFGFDLGFLSAFVPDVILSFADDGTGSLSVAGVTINELTWEYQGDSKFTVTVFDHDIAMTLSPETGVLSDEHGLVKFEKK